MRPSHCNLFGRFARAVAFAGLVLAGGSASAADSTHGEDVTVTGVKTDTLFVAGNSAKLDVTSPDDIYVAAKVVNVDRTDADHVFAAGNTVNFKGVAAHDIMTAGETVNLDTGTAKDDVFAFGKSISLRSTFSVTGSGRVYGQTVSIEAPIGGDLKAGGGDITLNSAVTGDVELEGEHLVIGPNARIGGDLTYRSDKIEISPQAVITGTKTALPARVHRDHAKKQDTVADRVGVALFGAAANAVLVIFTVLLFPGLIARSGRMILGNPLMAGVAGVVLPVAVLVAAVVLFALFLLGWIASVMLIALWLAVLPLAIVAIANALGRLIRGVAGKGKTDMNLGAQIGWSVLGVLILSGLGAIPVAGHWIWLVACLFGSGAVLWQGRQAWAKAD